jgi:fatty acid synthase
MPIALLLNCLFTGELHFTVMVQKASGNFEVTEGNAPVVSGLVRVPTNVSREMVALEPPKPIVNNELLELSSQDIYKYLRLCGYEYEGLFCGLVCADNHGMYHSMLYYMNSFSLLSLAVIHVV